MFGRGKQDKKSKLKPEQAKRQKSASAKNFKKQGEQDEADWTVSVPCFIPTTTLTIHTYAIDPEP